MGALNEQLLDDVTAHSIDLTRIEHALVQRTRALLLLLRDDLIAELSKVDPTGPAASSYRVKRLEALLREVKSTIKHGFKGLRDDTLAQLQELAKAEVAFSQGSLYQRLAADINTVSVSPTYLRNLVSNVVVEGAFIGDWMGKQAADLQSKFAQEIRMGVMRGESLNELIQRVRGTSTGKYAVIKKGGKSIRVYEFTGGLIDTTTRNAAALVRTSVHNVANAARLDTYKQNSDVIKGVEALVTLDTRTTPLCQGRSGRVWDLDGNPVGHSEPWPGPPPWHWNCRSTLVPVLKSWDELGTQAKGKLGNLPQSTQASMDGQVPEALTYFQWLTKKDKESPGFAKDVLGPTRYKLWQEGALTADDLITDLGKPMSTTELAKKAGLASIEQQLSTFAKDFTLAKSGPAAKQAALQKALDNAKALGVEKEFAEKLTEYKALIAKEVEKVTHEKAAKLSQAKKAWLADKKFSPSIQQAWDTLEQGERDKYLAKWQVEKDKLLKAAQKANAANPDVLDMGVMERIGGQAGSNPGGLYANKATGERWYVKFVDEDKARNEVLAARLYDEAGVRVPEVRFIQNETSGRTGVASRIVDGSRADGPAELAKAPGMLDGFSADAWLGNWDVVGLSYDNVILSKTNGWAIRIDVGGALRYRAQGTLKGNAFGPTIGEIASLRDMAVNSQSASVFAKVTDADLRAGAMRISAIPDNRLRELVDLYGPASPIERERLLATLIARRDNLSTQLLSNQPKPKPLPAVTPVSGKHLSPVEVERINAARSNGYAVDWDGGAIERQQALFWQEIAEDGRKLTMVAFKVREEGEAGLKKVIRDGFASSTKQKLSKSAKAARAAELADLQVTYDTALAKVKDLQAELKHTNINFVRQVTTALLEQEPDLFEDALKLQLSRLSSIKQKALDEMVRAQQALKATGGKLDQQALLGVSDTHKRFVVLTDAIGEGLGRVLASVEARDNVKDIAKRFESFKGQLALFREDPLGKWLTEVTKFQKNFTVKGASSVKYGTGEQLWPYKHMRNGFLHRTGEVDPYLSGRPQLFKGYYTEHDGVRMRAWTGESVEGRKPARALKNMVILEADGSIEETGDKLLAMMEQLNIHGKRPSAIEQEEVYLRQWFRQVNPRKAEGLATQGTVEERVASLKTLLREELGISRPVDQLPGYNPQGARVAFGDGYRVGHRPDILGDPRFASFQSDFAIVHQAYSDYSMSQTIERLLNSGGTLSSSVDRFRRGLYIGGMSTNADMLTGGADFIFTRLKKKRADGLITDTPTNGFIWKAKHAARTDAVHYGHDKYGSMAEDARNTQAKNLTEMMQYARNGSNELLFRDNLSIFDDLLYIVVYSSTERQAVIATLRKHKITAWPDGRRLEDVVVAPNMAKLP